MDAVAPVRTGLRPEQQLIIRFTPDIAGIIQRRMLINEPTGLVITPSKHDDCRLYHVQVALDDGSTKNLVGVVRRLPRLVESFKSLTDKQFLKSANVTEMLLVFDPEVYEFDPAFVEENFENSSCYSTMLSTDVNSLDSSWPSGLTVPNVNAEPNNITEDPSSISKIETEIVRINDTSLDNNFEYDIRQKSDVAAYVESYNFSRNAFVDEFVIGPTETVFEGADSDLMKVFFGAGKEPISSVEADSTAAKRITLRSNNHEEEKVAYPDEEED